VQWIVAIAKAAILALGVIAVLTALVRKRDPRVILEVLGIAKPERFLTHTFVGFAAAGSAMLTLFAAEFFCGRLEIVDTVMRPGRLWPLLLLIVAFGLVEEVFFRALAIGGLMALPLRRWAVLLGSSTLFALWHAGNPAASPWSVLGNGLGGLIYSWAFMKTGLIWLPFGLHVGWNIFQGPILGFPVSGLDMNALIEQRWEGPMILTGGDYGPEAGLGGLLARALAFGLTIWFTRSWPWTLMAESLPGGSRPTGLGIRRSDSEKETGQ